MKMKWMLLVIGSASGIALAATLVHGADRRPMVVKNITGNLHIVQKIPCETLTTDTAVIQGRIVIAPAEGIDVAGGKSFVLIGFTISFAPFTMSGSCLGVGGFRHYNFLSVQLGKAVAFTALDRGDGVFNVTIPKDEFLISEAAVVNDRISEKGFQHASQDVTGTIDLRRGTVAVHAVVARSIHLNEGCSVNCIDEAEPGTLTVDLSGTIAFPDSDADGVPDRDDNCRFVANPDQSAVATPIITAPANLTLASCADHHIGFAKAADICDGGPVTITNNARGTFVTGSNIVTWTARDTQLRTATDTQTVTVTDTVRPTVACVRTDDPDDHGHDRSRDGDRNRNGRDHDDDDHDDDDGPFFRVSSADDCTASPAIRLGMFVLANGEIVQITQSHKPGITFLGEHGHKHIKHFKVGPGQNVITATDGSGNRASAICR